MPDNVDDQVVPVRLADGNDMYDGRVEVFHDNRWGQILLNDYYGSNAKRVCSVVCNQLGYRCVQTNYKRTTSLFRVFMFEISSITVSVGGR